eukprot:scaffold3775_cov182-Pinguiococcus_pyrenoidosus.AAC.2
MQKYARDKPGAHFSVTALPALCRGHRWPSTIPWHRVVLCVRGTGLSCSISLERRRLRPGPLASGRSQRLM